MTGITLFCILMKKVQSVVCLLAAAALLSCNGGSDKPAEVNTLPPAAAVPQISAPVFEADSAYKAVETQVAFGPRTPGSAAQKKCADWMFARMKPVCDTVYRQNVTVNGGDGKQLPCFNLVGSINPSARHRILFLTHWDSRPWADQDTKDKDKPILAADDAGSGVGVLLEVARLVKQKGLPADWGIDIFFTDVEDYGKSEWGENSYCLGTQHWANHPHIPGYKADFGILLDMVGAKGARFPLEGLSTRFAGAEQQFVWQAASHAGYSSYFPFAEAAPITDDHLPVNQIAGIKCIDIINLQTDSESPFAPHWHTHNDNMQIIDKATLKAVGQTLLQVIYEKAAPQS
jgi:hypothetical protein